MSDNLLNIIKETIEKKLTSKQHKKLYMYILLNINPNIPRTEINKDNIYYTDINLNGFTKKEICLLNNYIKLLLNGNNENVEAQPNTP